MMQIPLTLPRPLRQDGDMQHGSHRTLLANLGFRTLNPIMQACICGVTLE